MALTVGYFRTMSRHSRLFVLVVIWALVICYFFATSGPWPWSRRPVDAYTRRQRARRMPPVKPSEPLAEPVPCLGPRGLPLNNSPDDDLRYDKLDIPYPVPFAGSQTDLGIEMTWMSADGRYGPYGYGEEEESYNRSKVEWDKVDWGWLMDSCLARNSNRFPQTPTSAQVANQPRLALWKHGNINIDPAPLWEHFSPTRRTALVIRAYDNFDYKAEDMWFIRSLITEASLKKGGEYTVVLLINVKDEQQNIFESEQSYKEAFSSINIPPELRSIALLWDDKLLQSWYPAVPEHRTMWQVNQPIQLFALHYPEFDHYWQIELDQRFLGDTGEYLDALSAFARQEPRKQALERSTFSYTPELSGTYKDFIRAVDIANKGRSSAWGHIFIPEINPIGPEPPVADPAEDDFSWGVGEEADVIVTGFCADVYTADWPFRDFITGFRQGIATPRYWCPPAVARASRALLHAIHADQHFRGMSIPSEAVFPTWALWLGLKLSLPPQPAYMHVWTPTSEFDDETSRIPAEWHNTRPRKWFGFTPEESPDGFAHSEPNRFADRGLTWWWASNYPRRIMDVWLANSVDVAPDETGEAMPNMLRVKDGVVYAPNFAMHPVKT